MTAKTILVIDDDDGVRDIVQLSLETATDWEVLTASSGKEGFAIASAIATSCYSFGFYDARTRWSRYFSTVVR